MKVSSKPGNDVQTVHGNRQKKMLKIGASARPRLHGASADSKVQLSSRSKETAKAKEAAVNSPERDVQARIADLKQKIASGTYNPDMDKVAEGMIKDHTELGF